MLCLHIFGAPALIFGHGWLHLCARTSSVTQYMDAPGEPSLEKSAQAEQSVKKLWYNGSQARIAADMSGQIAKPPVGHERRRRSRQVSLNVRVREQSTAERAQHREAVRAVLASVAEQFFKDRLSDSK